MIELIEFCGRGFITFYDVYDLDKKTWVEGEMTKLSFDLVIDQKVAHFEFNIVNALVFEKELLEDNVNYYMIIYHDGKLKKVKTISNKEYNNALEDNIFPKLEEC